MDFSREKALSSLKAYVKNEKTIVHSLASEAVMRALARRLGEDEDRNKQKKNHKQKNNTNQKNKQQTTTTNK
jgi:predicted hydrolase (HD superfamily)